MNQDDKHTLITLLGRVIYVLTFLLVEMIVIDLNTAPNFTGHTGSGKKYHFMRFYDINFSPTSRIFHM